MKLGFPPRAIDAARPEPVRPETAGRKVYVQRGKSDGDVQRPVFRLLGIDRGMIEILGHHRRFRGTPHVDRKSVAKGKRVSVRVARGGTRIITKKKKRHTTNDNY